MIAICLLTCDRPELTAIAARSFVEHHADRGRDLIRLHCDGGSATSENVDIAKAHGFTTLVAPPRAERIGQMATLCYFVAEAQAARATWCLWLENDWEFVAPLPPNRFITGSGVDTIRLFGDRKMRSGPRALAGTRRILTNDPIRWVPFAEGPYHGWEAGIAHWGAGGTLVRTDVLARQLHQPRLKDVIKAENNLLSLRPLENLMWCNGLVSTEGTIG